MQRRIGKLETRTAAVDGCTAWLQMEARVEDDALRMLPVDDLRFFERLFATEDHRVTRDMMQSNRPALKRWDSAFELAARKEPNACGITAGDRWL